MTTPSKDILIEDFPELQRRYDTQTGVVREFTSPRDAHIAFARAMRARGYALGSNHVWIKPGFAAVMEPA